MNVHRITKVFGNSMLEGWRNNVKLQTRYDKQA